MAPSHNNGTYILNNGTLSQQSHLDTQQWQRQWQQLSHLYKTMTPFPLTITFLPVNYISYNNDKASIPLSPISNIFHKKHTNTDIINITTIIIIIIIKQPAVV